MRRAAAVLWVLARFALAVSAFAGVAQADEAKMVGVITKIEIAGKDAKTAVATLKDTKSDRTIDVTINDDLTLDKLKDHRIVEGDEIRCKYETSGDKNVSKAFFKTAGC